MQIIIVTLLIIVVGLRSPTRTTSASTDPTANVPHQCAPFKPNVPSSGMAEDGIVTLPDGTKLSANASRFLPIKNQILAELKANPLDFENPPTEAQQDAPHPMNFVPEFDPADESNPRGQNSISLLNTIKKWEMELPSMSIIVQGGPQHPLMLFMENAMQPERRNDFLKSRPRLTDDYFDGSRDPVEGWMAAVKAWRLPAFYVRPNYEMPQFTFKPSYTLFIDASLQAQDDADLIGKEDRVNNEWIMDAVTHQPLCRQCAVKGHDGIFYWDLNVKQAVTPEGVMPPSVQFVGNMCEMYDLWYTGMSEQWTTLADNNPTMQSLIAERAKRLVGTTKPRCIRNWSRLSNLTMLHEQNRIKSAAESELTKGEVRVELTHARLNKVAAQIGSHRCTCTCTCTCICTAQQGRRSNRLAQMHMHGPVRAYACAADARALQMCALQMHALHMRALQMACMRHRCMRCGLIMPS